MYSLLFGAALSACSDRAPPTIASCTDALSAGGCQSGRCTLIAARGAIPAGTTVSLSDAALPPQIAASDALTGFACSVEITGGAPQGALTLSVSSAGSLDGSEVLARAAASGPPQLVPGSRVDGGRVTGLLDGAGSYVVTRRAAPSIDAVTGVDNGAVVDNASFFRSISTSILAAAYDGKRLYMGANSRVLAYDGLPQSPADRPALVLGQPDLVTTQARNTPSHASCASLFSDGVHLLCAHSHRVLIWSTPPTQDFAPADLVLGQPDFFSNTANLGGTSAASLNLAGQIDFDGQRLAVADTLNHRVLLWSSFPTRIGQPATSVIGQPSFTSSDISAGAVKLYQPRGVALTGAGLFLGGTFSPGLAAITALDQSNPPAAFLPVGQTSRVEPGYCLNPSSVAPLGTGLFAWDSLGRIGAFRKQPAGPSRFDFTLGQPDLYRVSQHPISASTVSGGNYNSTGMSGRKLLLLPDVNRLLVYDTPPTYHFEPASRVLGQPGFTTNDARIDYRSISAATLGYPADVATSGATLAVADRGNNRVLLYRKADLQGGPAPAQVVLGQPDARAYIPNVDQRSPSATTLSGPGGVALDGTHLIVADTENHRVLIWNAVPASSGAAADVVLGQADFTGRRPNRGRGDEDLDGFSDADADGLFAPTGVASDGTRLLVADRLNHRVLLWRTFPTQSGQRADAVLGQPSFTAVGANRGQGPYVVTADSLNLPTGVTIAGDSAWIADTDNNRLVRWDKLGSAPVAAAVLGQPDGATLANPNYTLPSSGTPGLATTPMVTAATLVRPRGVALSAGLLLVSEGGAHRVHLFDASSLASRGTLGQPSDTSSAANSGGLGPSALTAPAGVASDGQVLWVADSGNHRVVGYDVSSAPASFAAAVRLAGQVSFRAGGFNQASAAAGGVTAGVGGLMASGGELFVSDVGNNRVLVFSAPLTAAARPVRIYGQPSDGGGLANAGGSPSAQTLSGPRGIYADARRVVVADTGNHRVLLYDRGAGTSAAVVLGQRDFGSNQPNAGGAPQAGTLSGPSAAWLDGDRLYVADTGNHRVLVWRSVPTQSGQPADVVLGQGALTEALPNRGGGAAAGSLLFPGAVLVAGGVLYVADSGNNRVLMFQAAGLVSGGAASGALGQPDLGSRVGVRSAVDVTRLSNPGALASDGSYLYVLDRDQSRVLAYALPGVTGAAAVLPLSGLGGFSGGLAAEPTPLYSTRLYSSQGGGVVMIDQVSRLR